MQPSKSLFSVLRLPTQGTTSNTTPTALHRHGSLRPCKKSTTAQVTQPWSQATGSFLLDLTPYDLNASEYPVTWSTLEPSAVNVEHHSGPQKVRFPCRWNKALGEFASTLLSRAFLGVCRDIDATRNQPRRLPISLNSMLRRFDTILTPQARRVSRAEHLEGSPPSVTGPSTLQLHNLPT